MAQNGQHPRKERSQLSKKGRWLKSQNGTQLWLARTVADNSQKGRLFVSKKRTSPSFKRWQKVAENSKRKPIICKQKCGLRQANYYGQLTHKLPPSSCPLPQYPFHLYSQIFFGPSVLFLSPHSPYKRYGCFVILTFMFSDIFSHFLTLFQSFSTLCADSIWLKFEPTHLCGPR